MFLCENCVLQILASGANARFEVVLNVGVYTFEGRS